MSHTRFQDICSCVHFLSRQSYDSDGACSDLLWFCRSLIDQFIRKSVAVPLGASVLDENSYPTKARTRAKTYSPNKPAKYAICFYAIVGHQTEQGICQGLQGYMIIVICLEHSALLTIMLLGMIRGKIPWQAHPLHCGFA
jgi:hypothetical protein